MVCVYTHKKIWYVYTHTHTHTHTHRAIKKNEIMPLAATQMNLDITI